MLNATFLRNKVKRQIKQNGQSFAFVRYTRDEYHQLTDEVDSEFVVEGIFHTTNSYINTNTSDGAKVTSKPLPMILMLYEDGQQIEKDDKVVIEGETYIVNDKANVNSFNVAYEISLEVMKDEL